MNISNMLLCTLIIITIFNQPLLSFSTTIDYNKSPFTIPTFIPDASSDLRSLPSLSSSSASSVVSNGEITDDELSRSNLNDLFKDKESILKIQDEHELEEILLDCVEETRPGKKIVSNLADNYITRYFHLLDVLPVPDLISNGIGNRIVTDEGEIIIGNDIPNCINGKGGDDNIQGRDGSDKIFGNNGNDTLQGGPSNDEILGGLGDDFLFGDEGDDFLLGGSGNDTMMGGKGDDVLEGFSGADHFMCGDGDDVVLDYFPIDDDDIVEVDCEIIRQDRTSESPEQVLNGTVFIKKTLECFVDTGESEGSLSSMEIESIDCTELNADFSDFEINIDGNNPSPNSFIPESESESESKIVEVTIGAGEYSIFENIAPTANFTGFSNYGIPLGAECEGIIQNGEIKICEINNTVTASADDLFATLIITKKDLVCYHNGHFGDPAFTTDCGFGVTPSDQILVNDFEVSIESNDSSPPGTPFTFSGLNQPVIIQVNPGTYQVNENIVEGNFYSQFSPNYSGNATAGGELPLCIGTINVGETKFCDISNYVEKPPPIVT